MTTCPLGLGEQCYCASKKISFGSQPSERTAVLLLAHGSPDNPDQVPEFLKYVTGGRTLPPTVVEEIRHRYSLIGFSPLACWTRLQAHQLSQTLNMPVFVGMRNWKPFIGDTVRAIAADGYEVKRYAAPFAYGVTARVPRVSDTQRDCALCERPFVPALAGQRYCSR